MRSLMLVPASRRQVVQAPWHVFLLGKNHDKTDFVYRMLALVAFYAHESSKLVSKMNWQIIQSIPLFINCF
jgi:hypothetical protein